MIKAVDPMLNPDHLQAPSDAEISELTQRTTPAARARLEDAARALLIGKMMAKDTTPWRELVSAYRLTEPVKVEVEVVQDDGVPRVQVAYIERGFGIEGTDGRVHACVGELVRALDLIEREREQNRTNGAQGGRRTPKANAEEIARFLKRKGYESSPNKKALRIEAAERFEVGKTTITNVITDHGLSKRR